MNAQKESLIKKLLEFMQAPMSSQKKVCDENERKKRWTPKIFLMEGKSF